MKKYILNSRAVCYAVALIVLLALPRFVTPYHLTLMETGLSLAIMALGLNLLLRYTGVLSFGHGAYFAAGAYAVGLLYMYLPEHFSFENAMLASLLVSAVISALFGLVCVRHTRVFFSILTLALAMLLFAVLEKAYHFTGGQTASASPFPPSWGMNSRGCVAFSSSAALITTLLWGFSRFQALSCWPL